MTTDLTRKAWYQPGDRVTGMFYGETRYGNVIRHTVPNIVHVIWDNSDRRYWTHYDSISLSENARQS